MWYEAMLKKQLSIEHDRRLATYDISMMYLRFSEILQRVLKYSVYFWKALANLTRDGDTAKALEMLPFTGIASLVNCRGGTKICLCIFAATDGAPGYAVA